MAVSKAVVATGTMASAAMSAVAMLTSGTVASAAAIVAAVVGAVVVAAAGALAAAILVATAVDDDISSSAPSSSLSLVARLREHLLQTLDFMLQPFRRIPFSEFLIRTQKKNKNKLFSKNEQ